MNNKNAPFLKAEKITKWFGMTCALRDVTLEVYRGEIIGLLGPNGAGKSTLIKIISGYHKPDSGKIYIGGKEVHFQSPLDAKRYGIETVYQELAVVKDLKIPHNIFLGREPVKPVNKILRFIKPLDFKTMYEVSAKVLKDLGLTIPLDQEVQYCSGGEKQGIAIARCILFGAKLVILDEPYSALAIKGRRKVNQLLLKLKEKNISSIVISHDVHHVYGIADRFVILAHGRKIGEFSKDQYSLEELEDLIATAA